MTAPRPLLPVLPRFAVALLVTILAHATSLAEDAAESTPAPASTGSSPPTRRSHIQPVGEVAEASRNADPLGMRLSRASDVLRRQLGLTRGAGLVVEDVLAGSAAEKAGFHRHDVLVLLDDQMLLLPEQFAALLEDSSGATAADCTLLRGGAKVTILLGAPGPGVEPASGRVQSASPARRTAGHEPLASRPSVEATRQTAAKPSAGGKLRAPASALALVQPRPAASRTDAPGTGLAADSTTESGAVRGPADGEQILVREDADYRIRLSRGRETRLIVLDPDGQIVFNDTIDGPEHRRLVPAAVRQRLEEMERALEPATRPPVLEIGRLDIAPVEIR